MLRDEGEAVTQAGLCMPADQITHLAVYFWLVHLWRARQSTHRGKCSCSWPAT
jgi:hypothetical protein